MLAACVVFVPAGAVGTTGSTGQNGIGEDVGLVLDGEIAKVRMGVFVGDMFGKGLAGRCVYDEGAGIQNFVSVFVKELRKQFLGHDNPLSG